ncbi:MAG: hypothetical protein ACTHO8_10595 [Solirubrobacterales bacterium]
MVEPVTLGIIVAALAAKALERAEDGVIDGGVAAIRRVVGTLRTHFDRSADDEGVSALDQLADAPDSLERLGVLADLIDNRATRDAEFREALEALVKEARADGFVVESANQVAKGNQIVQVSAIKNSQMNISQGSPPREGGERDE